MYEAKSQHFVATMLWLHAGVYVQVYVRTYLVICVGKFNPNSHFIGVRSLSIHK